CAAGNSAGKNDLSTRNGANRQADTAHRRVDSGTVDIQVGTWVHGGSICDTAQGHDLLAGRKDGRIAGRAARRDILYAAAADDREAGRAAGQDILDTAAADDRAAGDTPCQYILHPARADRRAA